MNEDQLVLIKDCFKRLSKLSAWEDDFINNAQERLASGRPLTDRQSELLDEIWEKVT